MTRQPPYAVEAEQSVLGGLMLAPAKLHEVRALLADGDFYRKDHRLIYRAIVTLDDKGQPFDAVTMGEWLEANGQGESIGGTGYLMELASNTPSAANIGAYAEIVRDKATLRRLADAGAELADLAFSPGARSALEVHAEGVRLLTNASPQVARRLKSVKDGLREMVDALQRRYDADGTVSGVPTGIASLDDLTAGWQAGDLVIIAARPSMGKTAYALQAALAAGRTLFFSLEMTAGRLIERCVANLGQLPLNWLMFPNDAPDFASARVLEASRLVSAAELLIEDASGLSANTICAMARQAHLETPLRCIVVDHLGLIDRPHKHDPSELGQITTQLKRLAKDLAIPVLLLCQLNRGLESRTDKRPVLSDLRDSGRIEEDADVVVMLYRAEYYDEEPKGFIELMVRKNRNGERETAWAESRLAEMRMVSCDRQERPAAKASRDNGGGGFPAPSRKGSLPSHRPRYDAGV